MRKILIAVLPALVASLSAGADVDYGSSYFAPENYAVSRMVLPNGAIRQFQRDALNPGVFRSSDGWTGLLVGNGHLVVRSPSSANPAETYEYEGGRLVGYACGEKQVAVPYDTPRTAPPLEVSPLATITYEDVEAAFSYERKETDGKWLGTGRLAFPYVNPNQSGALYCLLALAALSAFECRRISVRVVGGVLFSVCAGLLAWTESRGAMAALAVGLLSVLYCHRRSLLKSRMFWCAALAACVTLSVWVIFRGHGMLTRGFASTGALDWSNQVRVDMWKAAPQMMADAPGGWGFAGVGLSYLNWYQPLKTLCLTGSLMNDHLTTLVRFGWCGRFLYLLAWGMALSVSLLALVRSHRPIPLAASLAVAVLAWFNPIYGCWGVWAAYALSLPSLGNLGRKIGRRTVVGVLLAAGAGAAVVSVSLYTWGKSAPRADGCRIRAEGERVLVGAGKPSVWIVDDGQGALGGVLACKEMRMFFLANPEAPAMGYVRRVEDLPREGIARLALVGKAATDWLLCLSENEAAREHLPQSVLLVTPPFAPYEVPEGVLKCCAGRVIVGEFAARFQPDYAVPRAWITIVPGAERYIPNWMAYVLGG